MRIRGGDPRSCWRKGVGTEGKCACAGRPPLAYHLISKEAWEKGSLNLRLRFLHGLVRDDKVVKQVTSLLDGVDQLICEESRGDFGALAHDGGPDGQFGVILGKSDRDIVPLLPKLFHLVLIHDSPDESVVGALRILAPKFGGARNTGDDLGLLSVKGVDGGAHGVLRHGVAVEEEANDEVGEEHHGVEALHQRQLDVYKGHILSTSGIGGIFEQALFFQHLVGFVVGDARSAKANLSELAIQQRRVRLGPRPGLGAVESRAEEVQGADDGDDGEDEAFGAELPQTVALVHIIPFRVWARSRDGTIAGQADGNGL